MGLLSVRERVLEALRGVVPSGASQDIVELGIVTGLAVRELPGGVRVSFALEAEPSRIAEMEPLRAEAEAAVRRVSGVAVAVAGLTIPKKSLQGERGEAGERHPAKISLPGVKRVIAVASGKGGVGKSTTAVNLALAFARLGLKVGLVDADIYGPSIPRMLAVSGRPEIRGEDRKMIPHQRYGLSVMSIGFLVTEDAPMIWRGPMVHGAVTQLFRDVAWEGLDILVVDLPPGTGDAQLTLAQSVPLAGAVIVSTPQDLALIDARKGLAMFQRVGVSVLGIIENMSWFLCPHCGGRSEIFSHGGAEQEALKLGVPFLGALPLDMAVRETSDAGAPIVYAQPDGDIARIYGAIAAKIEERL
ncbi:MAG: Mrp/NBP35 family ATP-binding protein [Bdellovibrionales bacterium]